jgi:hypothetical protein
MKKRVKPRVETESLGEKAVRAGSDPPVWQIG